MRTKQCVCKVLLTPSEVCKIEQLMGEKLPHKIIDEIEIACKCDVCRKPIELGSYFFRVLKGHRDWGNDSHESQKWFDICSQECLQEMYRVFDAMSDDTKYIEISRERW